MEEDKNGSVNIRNKNALCYIPLVAFFINHTENKKSSELKKHIKYGMLIFFIFALLNVFLGWIFGVLLLLGYLGFSGYLGFKAYSGEIIDLDLLNNIDFLDNFINKSSNNQDSKNNEKESSDKDDDVLNF